MILQSLAQEPDQFASSVGIIKVHESDDRVVIQTLSDQFPDIDCEVDDFLRCADFLSENPQRPELLAWDEAYRRFGVNPRKHRPAVCQLTDRIRQSVRPLPFINEAVAIFNIISLTPNYLRPCGGDDIDHIRGNLVLDVATGEETFEPLGKPGATERPDAGEIIYVDDASKSVMCRRMNWRNGHPTRITSSTRNLVINIDGMGDADRTRHATQELADLLHATCGGAVEAHFMNSEASCITLSH